MAHQSNARGSLVIDKRYRGVGRLKRATGTRDTRILELYVGMCDTLYACGSTEWLHALIRGGSQDKVVRASGLSFAEAWTIYRPTAGRTLDVTRLPSPETVRRLWRQDEESHEEVGALATWVAALDASATHQDNIARDVRWLRQLAKPTATVADLPTLIASARVAALKAQPQRRRSFNMLRTTAQAFLRDTVGVRHALYFAVQDTKPLDERRKKTSGLTPVEMRAVIAALGPTNGEAFRALCLSGMRPAEYWQEGVACWTAHVDRLVVVASKTDGGTVERVVPLVDRRAFAVAPAVARRTLHDRLWRLSTGHAPYPAPWPRNVSMYDARRTFRNACDLAGVPDSRGKVYRSASARTVDERYKEHTITAEYLADDTAKLRAWFGVDDGPGLTLIAPAPAPRSPEPATTSATTHVG